MNIVKGIDRIGVVSAIGLAVVAFFPIFDELSRIFENPHYFVWQENHDHRVSQLEEINPSIKVTPRQSYRQYQAELAGESGLPGNERENRKAEREIREKVRMEKERERESVLNADKELQEILATKPAQLVFRPLWKKIVLSGLGSLAVLFAVFLGICGTTRGVKRLGLWIIQGFKS